MGELRTAQEELYKKAGRKKKRRSGLGREVNKQLVFFLAKTNSWLVLYKEKALSAPQKPLAKESVTINRLIDKLWRTFGAERRTR